MNDPLAGLFGSSAPKSSAPAEKGLPTIRGKVIAGVLYVRAVDVADALEQQAPTVNRRLIVKLRRPV